MLDLATLNPHVVLVDDEKSELDAYGFLLRSMGVTHIYPIRDSTKVLEQVEQIPSPIIFLDLNMPEKSGLEVLRELKEQWPQIPVIICTANSEIETAVACLKQGAHDYLVKPINLNSFGSALRTALAIGELRTEVMSLKGLSFLSRPHEDHPAFKQIITQSKAMHAIFSYIRSVAPSGQPVLILGETGCGKELLAKAIHDVSINPGEFIAIDVSGLDDTLFSDSLFGHARGAYTGAVGERSGLLEKAADGTIFLDEIGDLSEISQVKLLRVLQEGIYYPLGSDQPKRSRARVVAATNKDLTQLIDQGGNFRRDLYYRLSTHLIKVPPLRERREDLPLLVDYLLSDAAESMGKQKPQLSRAAVQLLQQLPFYGNVRELKSYLYDAVARCQTDEIPDTLLQERLSFGSLKQPTTPDLTIKNPLENLFGHFPTLEELYEYSISQALQATANNQSQAAKLLGISKQALNKRLKKR